MAPPAKICSYSILAEIGSGGMGTVYRARDANGREVALKVMLPELVSSASARERFKLESMLHPHHSNIVQVFDAGICEGHPFFAMQFVDGPTLEALLKAGRLPTAEVLPILRQIASALDTAHMRGVIHRDVKPSNILVRSKDKAAFLTDFGVAKTPNMNMTQVGGNAGPRIGTPRYMAPEQVNNLQLTPQSDIYSLAIVIFEALAGRSPFVAKETKVLLEMQRKEKPPEIHTLAPVPRAISAVLLRALSKEPAQRYATAGDFALAFEQAAHGSQRRRNLILATVAVLAIGLLAVGGYAGWTNGFFGGTSNASGPIASATVKMKVASATTAPGATATLTTATPASARATLTNAPTETSVATSTLAPTLTPTNTPRPFTRTPTPQGAAAATKAP